MIPGLFSVLRLRQQRTRLLLQQMIKREHLNEQQIQEGVHDRQRAVLQGRYGDYVFKTLGRPPPPPPPRQSALPGQGNEQAPEGERSVLDFQADFERAEEGGKAARSESRGEEDADSRSTRERGGEERLARSRDAVEASQDDEDIFLQPGSQPAQQEARGGDSGAGGQSGGRQSGQGGGERGQRESASAAQRLQQMQKVLDRFEAGLSSQDPQERADTLVSTLAEIVWAKHGVGHPVQAMLLARIAKYLSEQHGEEALSSVAKVKEALLRAGMQGVSMPSDRFALLPLQLLNCSRPRTREQRRLASERLDGGSAWLASETGPRA